MSWYWNQVFRFARHLRDHLRIAEQLSSVMASRKRWLAVAAVQKDGDLKSPLQGPEEVELFLERGEVFVAGGEGCLALGGEGGGETIHVGELRRFSSSMNAT